MNSDTDAAAFGIPPRCRSGVAREGMMTEGLEFDHQKCCAHAYYYQQHRVKTRTAKVGWHQDVCMQCRDEVRKDGGTPPWLRQIVLWRQSERNALRRTQKGFQETPPDAEDDGTDFFDEAADQDGAITEIAAAAQNPLEMYGIGQANAEDSFGDAARGLAEWENEMESVKTLMVLRSQIRATSLEHAAAIARWFGNSWEEAADWHNTMAERGGLPPVTACRLEEAAKRWNKKMALAGFYIDDFRP
jgi:hypothetical protein